MSAYFSQSRKKFHADVLVGLIRFNSQGVPNFADTSSKASSNIAKRIVGKMEGEVSIGRVAGQTSGKLFEDLVLEFIQNCFGRLGNLRPGTWGIKKISSRDRLSIAQFEQYAHLVVLDEAARSNPALAAALGSDYTITPDILMFRVPEPDDRINEISDLVDDESVTYAILRQKNSGASILHASISCKWTIRSDRSQNCRTEALNLIRNRKGKLPHIIVVTAEPLPSRIASIALGTGDIDCVYHLALYELIAAVREADLEDAGEMLRIMVEGKRLRDISDLPLDLAT
ncbi:NgoMIV family type II restriction endonuclease [Coleofasciculus sp. H7-2]|uniref:NgoMIV family type II restriction endonuclease n=1 Tax=Coleofasciculus sp. H7-2 TaxID=3351545 RepID=UPI003672C226